MSIQYLQLREAFPTFCAGIRTLSGVDLLVLVQKPHMREAFPALACKWALSGVFHLMSSEV